MYIYKPNLLCNDTDHYPMRINSIEHENTFLYFYHITGSLRVQVNACWYLNLINLKPSFGICNEWFQWAVKG